ncbi:MAG: DUF2115 domain-containing protein [Euryarchaeota archaeon]|nr:DUF2115 domain-containing protein [Euryarchaeota archaeon]
MNTEELLDLLKTDATEISICDIMKIRTRMAEEVRYLPERYKRIYLNDLFEHLYLVFLNINRSTRLEHIEDIDPDIQQNIVQQINEQVKIDDPKGKLLGDFLKLTSLYLIFIAKKPIHPVGMTFPGGQQIVERDGNYYCPVKDKQSKVKPSMCEFCICKDLDEIE